MMKNNVGVEGKQTRYSPMHLSMMRNNLMGTSQVSANKMLFNQGLCTRSFGVETIKVPGMGDSISEGTIEEFVKQPGEFVNADEIIARIETDKVTVDIKAPVAGVIKEYMAGEGDTVEVGADFYLLDTDATSGSAAPAAPKAEAPPA